MKKITVILILLITSYIISELSAQVKYKLEDFGLHSMRGGIDINQMTKKQIDTIVVCPINYEDQLPDVCVSSNSKKEVIIYRCLGNGFFDVYKTIPLDKNVRKIESSLTKDYPVYLTPFYDLKITYADGIEQTIYNYKINSFNTEPEPRVPKWNFLNDARAFIYDFSFMKVWQSERNGQPQNTLALGDIDNDGKNEMVYTFFPLSDSIPQYIPAHMVVFESIGHDQFIIDWDTIFQPFGGGNGATHILTDFDRNGKKEFWGGAYDPNINSVVNGFFECSGERKYRFWAAEDLSFWGPITDVFYLDTMKVINATKKPGMWISYYPSGFYPNYFDKIVPYIFNRKYEVFGFGNFEFKTVPNDATNFIRIPWRIDDIDVADIDRDGKDEIVLGLYGGNDFIDYLDSTGVNYNIGYQYKTITPGVPLTGGWIFTKDFDNDGYNEIIACGIGYASGSFGILKHTGVPGENQFTIMYWDTVGLVGQPNWGIDSGTINNKFTILYPTIEYQGPLNIENINTFAREGMYNFYKSSLTILDSTSFIGTKFFDIDKDNKMDIVTPVGFDPPPVKQYLSVYKLSDVITNTPNSNNNIENNTEFRLFQNYPNPFNPSTKINFDLTRDERHEALDIKLVIYNVLGIEVATLVNERRKPGSYQVEFEGTRYSSGIYFYSLSVNGNVIDTKKMLLIK